MGKSEDISLNEVEEPAKKDKPSRIPKCGRCQNHGKKVQVKYHKRTCEFRYCLCHMCILTSKRQQIMKVQTRQRRERQQYEMLMEMQKKEDSKTPPALAPSVNGSSRSTPPSLSSHNSNGEPSRSIGEPPVSVPMPQNLQPILPHMISPETTLFEPESNTEQVENLLGYSARLLQRFGYLWESLSLMYVILKDCGSDVEVAMQRIIKANREIQATAQFKASRFGGPYPYYAGYTANMGTLGNPTYFGPVPYVGMASPPTTAQLGLFPYTLDSHVVPKVPSSPDSPPERPSSYADFMKSRKRPLNGSMESMLEPSDKGVHMESSSSLPGFRLDTDFMKNRRRGLNISMENMLVGPPKGACAETSMSLLEFRPTDSDFMKSRRRPLNISMEDMLVEPPKTARVETSPSLLGFRPLDSDASNQSHCFKIEKSEDTD